MRVLFTGLHPDAIGGVATWISTLRRELCRRGIQSDLWGPKLDFPLKTGKYEVGVFSNPHHTRTAIGACKVAVQVSHGVIDAEKPIEGIPAFFTSEEVKEKHGGEAR